MDNEVNTSNAVTGGVNVASAAGGENDNVVSLKELLSGELGRNYESDEAALKSVKDTFGYVGKVGKILPTVEKLQQKFGGEDGVLKAMEELAKTPTVAPAEVKQEAPKIDESKFISKDQYEADMFYSKNPDYEPHREIINALQTKTGKPLSEVVQLDAFKTVFEKVRAHDESAKSKSVLQSNPRLGQVTDKITKAKSLVGDGQFVSSEAKELATQSVVDAFELRK